MKRFFIPTLLVFMMLITATKTFSQETKTNEKAIFIGTYTKKEGHVDGQANGIYSVCQNTENGSLRMVKTVAEVTNPSFVKVSDDGKYLYAVSELGEGDAKSGFVYAFKINTDDSLEELNKLSTEAFAPAHVEADKTGNYIFVSNYMGGVVMMYEKQADGSLKKQQHIDLENPQQSHAHSVSISSDNKHAYIADLGNDKIWIFDLDAKKGKLTPNQQKSVSLEDGAGPRHFTFSKNDKYAYSMNELNSTVSVFEVKIDGGLKLIQSISSLPEGFSEDNSGADIHMHSSGKYLYASNRGHNSIVSYKVNQDSGKLTLLDFTSTQGKTPRNFALSPHGQYLYAANQDSNTISVFKIDSASGKLQPHLKPLEINTPVCIEFAD